MAKKDEGNSEDRQRQLDFIARGEQVEGGWCVDFDHPETVYRCSEEEEAIARGDLSVSVDRSKVLDMRSGEVTEREADWSRFNPMGMVDLGGGVPTATSVTGGGARGPLPNGGNGGNAVT
jgi:hypothetical protein